MEDMTARANDIEEIETTTEVEESMEDSNSGALVAGIIGGFLAYAMIGGAKKLWGFVAPRLAERRQAKLAKTVEAEIVEEAQTESDEDDSEK